LGAPKTRFGRSGFSLGPSHPIEGRETQMTLRARLGAPEEIRHEGGFPIKPALLIMWKLNGVRYWRWGGLR
jgi:hypothetical protein